MSGQSVALWYFESDSVYVDLTIKSGVEIERNPGSKLDYLSANVTFVPEDTDSQEVMSLSTTPKPYSVSNRYVFRWDDPVPSNPGYVISASMKTKNVFHDVKKLSFPYIGFPDDVEDYLEPTKTIDSNNSNIISKASELASGETDYYAVVHKFAEWTKANVKYDLSTLNVKASKKASWVLAQKDGVCDEITTLFIALLRSVGIPARFVSGIAYTESPDFPQNWGAHGWAEVYFPGTGWVPFDVTYGEYGFVDPTHILLKVSHDSAEPDTKYEWLGKDVEITPEAITVNATLVKHSGSVADNVAVSVSMVQDTVGIGSYNVVEAELRNKRNSYVSTLLFLARVNELSVAAGNQQSVMLKPLETKKVYWLVKVLDDLDTHYTYTFPMTVATMRNTSADTSFAVIPGATAFSKQEMQAVIDAAKKEESKVYSKKIELNRTQDREYYYTYDDPKVSCSARNTGNFPFSDLEFCFKDECQAADLGISQEKEFDYVLHDPKEGINKIEFSIDGKDVSKSVFYDVEVYDEPDVSVDDLEYPSQIEFRKPYTVSFTLKKDSMSEPHEGTLTFDAAGIEKEVEFEVLRADKKFLFNLNSEDLSTKPNRFTIAVNYEDLNNKTYTEKEEFEIPLVNVTFGQRVVIWLYDADRWLRNIFK
ncbi:hypothetical protein KY363_03365 [Candidatus Woesearchaeota archaeon]|nr:hypothetical protein [Candidatus Woesearchaeota archaeon]